MKSRPATSGVPCVRNSPGDTTLTCRLAGVRPSSAMPSHRDRGAAAVARPSGSRVANATDVTPGSAASRSTTSCCMRVTRSGSATVAAGIVRAERLHAAGFGETRDRRDAAPGSCGSSALCRPAVPAPAPAAPRPGPAAIAAARGRGWRRARRAVTSSSRGRSAAESGSSPNSSPEASAIASAKPSAVGSTAISSSRGRCAGPIATSARTPAAAIRTPSRPPSERQHQALDQELAGDPRPARAQGARGWRTPAGGRRRAPAAGWRRWRRRCSRTTPIAPRSTHSAPPTSPTTSWTSGCSAGAHRARNSGSVLPRVRTIPGARGPHRHWPAPSVTPGLSRATPSSRNAGIGAPRSIRSGRRMSDSPAKRKPAGITPMI